MGVNQTCKKLITPHLYNMNKILICVIQVKYTASISNRVNGVECDISVFFAVAYCSVVEFERSGIVFYQSLEELSVERYFDPCLYTYSFLAK